MVSCQNQAPDHLGNTQTVKHHMRCIADLHCCDYSAAIPHECRTARHVRWCCLQEKIIRTSKSNLPRQNVFATLHTQAQGFSSQLRTDGYTAVYACYVKNNSNPSGTNTELNPTCIVAVKQIVALLWYNALLFVSCTTGAVGRSAPPRVTMDEIAAP
jgi:hypothetical protein